MQVKVLTTTAGADLVSEILLEAGSEGTMIEDKNDVFKTVSVYVTKFAQDAPAATAAWLTACTLLSVSSGSTAMHNVFNYVLYEEDSVSNEILALAGREAVNVFKLEYNKRELATTLKKAYGVDV